MTYPSPASCAPTPATCCPSPASCYPSPASCCSSPMGKRGKPDESSKEIPEYDKQRLKRVACNIARMEAAGLKSLFSSHH
ncbi:hypothetical protein V2J09_006639 [Rumex salicifolius]